MTWKPGKGAGEGRGRVRVDFHVTRMGMPVISLRGSLKFSHLFHLPLLIKDFSLT